MNSVLLAIHIILCVGIVAMVLMQRTDSDGMGSLGGGGGGGNMNSFLTGRAASNLLTRTTAILVTCFFLTSLALTLLSRQGVSKSILDAVPATGSEPVATAAEAEKPAEKTEADKKEQKKPSVPIAQ